MAKAAPIQSNFSAGEFDPTLNGRVDLDRYKNAVETCKNYIPTLQGGALKRPGTMFVAEVKDSTKAVRLIPFEFSVEQAYILEFGDLYIRFYRDHGQILSGPPYEIVSPYAEADLDQIRFVQSADIMYLVHPDYEPRKLSRTGHTAWTLTTPEIEDGPYDEANTTSTTMTPSAATGSGVTLTASAVTGINGDTGFQTTDVGRSIRLREGSVWGWARIVGHTSTTQVTIDIESTLTDTTTKTNWRLGVWSETTGYPATVTFHEDRLFFGGVPDFPQRMDGSVVGQYENFRPSTLASGTVVDSDALSFTFNSNNINVVRWLISDEKGLIVGTVGGEWIVRPSSQGEALVPSNITAKKSTTYGSADIDVVQVGKSSIFVQRAQRKVRELTYFFDVDGFRAADMSLLSAGSTTSGVKEMAHQKEPQPIVWCVRNDGVLAGMTYERDVDNFRLGWHRHIIGGVSDAAGSDAKVESVASIPSPDGFRDDAWIVVQRWVDGAIKRYVEYITPQFEDSVDQKDGFFVDSGLTYDLPITVSGATQADPCVVTTATHSFSDGDKVLFEGVAGMTELNTESYIVANKTATTFELTDSDGNNIDSTAFGAYISGGEVRKYVSTISGLSHLEGESVTIAGDGAAQANQTVASGAVTLQFPATTIHIGLGYESRLKLLRLDAGSRDGTSIGKTRRIHRVSVMFHRSLGLKLGFDDGDLDEITFRTFADPMSRAVALFTGIKTFEAGSDYNLENQIVLVHDQPLPSMILAVMPLMASQDR